MNDAGPVTTPCTRFETEALELLERGETLDRHFETCDDCLEARRVYDALTLAIGQTEADAAPADDWQDTVWSKLESRRHERRFKRQSLWGLAGLAAAAALATVLVRSPADSPIAMPLRIDGAIVDSGVAGGVENSTVVRSLSAKPGDTLQLKAEVGDRSHVELRLYREEHELILRCSSEPPCQRDGSLLSATVVLPAVGLYQPIVLASDSPLPDGVSTFDQDAGQAIESGAEVAFMDDIDVR